MQAEQQNRVGLVVFWIAVVWMILWAVGTAPMRVPLLHSLALDEYNQTIWAHTRFLGTLFGVSVPLGALVAGVGLLIYSGAKGCDGYVETAPVGSFPDGASWVGALDMSGNVLEWLADWHDRNCYEHSPRDNSGGSDSGEFRVMRGGSWLDFDGDFVRGALRRSALPVGVADYYGIRCALSYQ